MEMTELVRRTRRRINITVAVMKGVRWKLRRPGEGEPRGQRFDKEWLGMSILSSTQSAKEASEGPL